MIKPWQFFIIYILTPRVYVADNKKSDYLDSIDYVPSLCYEWEEQVLFSQHGSEIVLNTGVKTT